MQSSISAPDALILLAPVLVVLAICFKSHFLSRKLKVLDLPDDARKHHRVATPMMGGVAILVPLALWALTQFLLRSPSDPAFLRMAVLGAVGSGIIGFADDQAHLSPLARILALIFLSIMAFCLDPRLVTGWLNFGTLGTVGINWWCCAALLTLTAVGLVNSVNMADGQNGLVLGMYLVWAICFLMVGTQEISAVIVMLMPVLAIVLCFNLMNRLFLGDAGSYGVTFLFGIMAAFVHARYLAPLQVIIVWFFIPVIDCIRLIVIRSVRGTSPAQAGRDHLHHILSARLGNWWGRTVYLGTVAVSSVFATLKPQFAIYVLALVAVFYGGLIFLFAPDARTPLAQEQ